MMLAGGGNVTEFWGWVALAVVARACGLAMALTVGLAAATAVGLAAGYGLAEILR